MTAVPGLKASIPESALEEVACGLCGGSRRDVKFTDGPFSVVTCSDCGLTYVSPRLGDAAAGTRRLFPGARLRPRVGLRSQQYLCEPVRVGEACVLQHDQYIPGAQPYEAIEQGRAHHSSCPSSCGSGSEPNVT